jgi:uncharacterized membrane protein YbhN (UPF0104 family)
MIRFVNRAAVLGVGAIVLAASAAYIATSFQWRAALQLLARADLATFLVGSSAAILGYFMVRAFRWRYLMSGMQVKVGFLDLYLCSSVALSLSILTPLQSGEALKVELLRKYGGFGRLPGYSAFALERAADLYVVISIGAVALLAPSGSVAQALLLLGVFMALPVAAYLVLHRIRLSGRVGDFVRHLQQGVGDAPTLAVLLASTFLSWAIVALGWQACLASLSIVPGFTDMRGLLSVVCLASILSFLPGGLGIAEASTTEFLIRYGVQAAPAQAGALMLRGFSILVILLGSIHLLVLRERWRRGKGAP